MWAVYVEHYLHIDELYLLHCIHENKITLQVDNNPASVKLSWLRAPMDSMILHHLVYYITVAVCAFTNLSS